MALTVASIVEGHGEVVALPLLLRRIGEWRTPDVYVDVPTPIRVHRDRFLNREDEFRRHLLLAAGRCGTDGWVLILLDADDDCPATRGAEILRRATDCLPGCRISVVLANREYEAWFIAAAESLHGQRGFVFNPNEMVDAETPRNAKGWVGQHMGAAGYGEVLDQPAFSATMDLQQAFNGSRSFRKLCSEWEKHVLV
ncbi:DUF4276 family protein [Burkholderia cenocepacia]|uniref:DUF4276 family protein n=1 Tax=Burkholderia cenocepacia TaxID=95486 RepID=UPI002858BBB7|nr:DUF4276 family protein [Burkholderia cenocepacia]MDR8027239.1 DUF4276 family protein [Burkholderia cenocepacia]MDR8044491.1 DUF4276 family protein [Burkholderia cenocepacia]MDR8078013.1 DUF4276 family protein [Burkholderia cenocepacia]